MKCKLIFIRGDGITQLVNISVSHVLRRVVTLVAYSKIFEQPFEGLHHFSTVALKAGVVLSSLEDVCEEFFDTLHLVCAIGKCVISSVCD